MSSSKKLTCKGSFTDTETEFNTLYLTNFRTYKIATPPQTKTWEGRGPPTDKLPQSPFSGKFFQMTTFCILQSNNQTYVTRNMYIVQKGKKVPGPSLFCQYNFLPLFCNESQHQCTIFEEIFFNRLCGHQGAPSLSLRKRNLKLKRKFRFAWKRKKSLISHDSLRCETPKI